MSSTPPPPPPPPSSSGGESRYGVPAGSGDGNSYQAPPETTPAGIGPAGRTLPPVWKRIVARFLDGLIISFVFGAAISAIVLSGDDDGGLGGLGADASAGKLYVLGLIGAAVGFVWDGVCTKIFGGSPMKLAFGMRVVRAESGDPVLWSNAIIRWAIPGAFALIPLANLSGIANLIVVVVSLVFLFTKPLRQAVWDLAAKTVVVDK